MNWLPDRLPQLADAAWNAPLPGEGIGGIAVAAGAVVCCSRDVLDQADVIQCFDAESGELLWQHFCPARGRLDYGNSPRACPLIAGEYVYTLGAFGHLCCLELETGFVTWQRNLAEEYPAPPLTWGYSGSPLIIDGHLIVQPGSSQASLVSFDPENGDLRWASPGDEASYSSFISCRIGETGQLIGFDTDSLGGWDVATGERLWKLQPRHSGDFNVPTPVVAGKTLLLTSENNGLRQHRFSERGIPAADPSAEFADLNPDSHTPVVHGDHVFGVHAHLYAIDLRDQFATVHELADDAFAGYASVIAAPGRLLVLSESGELLLVAAELPQLQILSRISLTDGRSQVLSHPAVAGDSVYVRVGRQLLRLRL